MSSLNWRAIGIAVAIGLGGSMLFGVLFDVFVQSGEGGARPMVLYAVVAYGSSTLIDIVTGGVAGGLARVRGALHGFVAGVIANVTSPLLGLAMQLARGQSFEGLSIIDYLGIVAAGAVLGIIVTTIAAAIAAAIMRRRVATP